MDCELFAVYMACYAVNLSDYSNHGDGILVDYVILFVVNSMESYPDQLHNDVWKPC